MKKIEIKTHNYGIEEDIDPLGRKILNLNNIKNNVIKNEFKDQDIDHAHFGLLIHVYRNQGLAQESLRKRLGYDKTTLSKVIGRLIKKGFLFKEKNVDDGRSFCIFCTEKTVEIIPEISKAVILEQEIFSKGFSQEEISLFYKLLNKATNNFEEYLK